MTEALRQSTPANVLDGEEMQRLEEAAIVLSLPPPVEIVEGVRQLITNQEEIFNLPFFASAQLLLAGNDSRACATGRRRRGKSSSSNGRRRRPDVAPVAAAPISTALFRTCAARRGCSISSATS